MVLNETAVTDAGLTHLYPLTELEKVHLKLTKVTEAGVKQLAAALPKQMGWIDDAARAQRKAELEARMAVLRNELERL